MENVRKHKDIELVHTKERLQKVTAKPTYKNTVIFNEDLAAVELARSKVKLNKPSYSGMCILGRFIVVIVDNEYKDCSRMTHLTKFIYTKNMFSFFSDLSKYLMYDFWYNYIKKRYGIRSQLQMTDTDSLLLYCETEDIYKDMVSFMDLFDTSDYPKDHPLHCDYNKKVLGKMKDETKGSPIDEFVGLRSKMYSLMCNRKETKRAKGIAKVTVEKILKHGHYKDTLFEESSRLSSMTSLRSNQHELFCVSVKKKLDYLHLMIKDI